MNTDSDPEKINPEVQDEKESGGHAGTDIGDETARVSAEPGANGWSTTTQAARALGVSSRTIRRYVETGDLIACRRPGQGSQSTLEIDIDSLQQIRMRRMTEGHAPIPTGDRDEDAEADKDARVADGRDTLADMIERLSRSYADARADAASAQARLELTERAESSLREEVAKERRRADEAEDRTKELERAPGG